MPNEEKDWMQTQIEEAQRSAGVPLNQFGGRFVDRIFAELSPKAQKAYEDMNIPRELLTNSATKEIRTYAQMCGITWPAEEPK